MRFLPAGLCFFVAAALVFFWNLRLRRLIKQKTISLKESEKRLDQALDQANLGSWDCNLLTGEAINNKHYSLMLRYSQI